MKWDWWGDTSEGDFTMTRKGEGTLDEVVDIKASADTVTLASKTQGWALNMNRMAARQLITRLEAALDAHSLMASVK